MLTLSEGIHYHEGSPSPVDTAKLAAITVSQRERAAASDLSKYQMALRIIILEDELAATNKAFWKLHIRTSELEEYNRLWFWQRFWRWFKS